MSITTRRGDDGTTDLMFGRRVSKSDPRVVACGAVDELNAVMGVARRSDCDSAVQEELKKIQEQLILLMGELATAEEDRERYFKEGFKPLTSESVDALDALIIRLEKEERVGSDGWATPGARGAICAAQLDVCRTVCRRAERAAVDLLEKDMLANHEALRYLNRLSDAFWLLARVAE